uniref:Rrp15p-domain-containing protein n=1 Tax=Moniliophthora roreri TaxID=221103 RepID=A0A0W0FGP2_MONRR
MSARLFPPLPPTLATAGNNIIMVPLKRPSAENSHSEQESRPNAFGATLQTLLSTGTPPSQTGNVLALKPSVNRKRDDELLEKQARQVLQVERKEKEDKGRIRGEGVLEEWGAEAERGLRKVAQRGVVKLFNYIQESQVVATHAAEEKKAQRGTGKPTLPAPSLVKEKKGKKDKDNLLGRGKEAAVGKDDFFDMIRTGSVVSKA